MKMDEKEVENKTKDMSKYMKTYFEKPEIKERYRNYGRDWMRYTREKKKNPEINISFKEWRRNNGGCPKDSEVEKIIGCIKDIRKYPIAFPIKEFNKKLDEILKNNTVPINEKKLKDILMWDVLDRKGLLTTERIARILNYNSSWNKPIEDIMNEREYICVEEDGERRYFPPNPQTSQR